MTAPFHNEIQHAYVELEQTRASLAELSRQYEGATFAVTDRNRSLTVSVNSSGEVVEVKFLNRTYRGMAPSELSNLIVETIRSARAKALADITGVYTDVLPAGAPLAQILDGRLDLHEFMADLQARYERMTPEVRDPHAPEAGRG